MVQVMEGYFVGHHTCRRPGLASTAARSCGLAWTIESCNMQPAPEHTVHI